MYKRQPLDKTLVVQFGIQIADINMRSRQLEGSIASKIGRDSQFRQGDRNVDLTNTLVLDDIKSSIVVHSFGDFNVSITKDGSTITSYCSGLFIYTGILECVEISSTSETPIRLSYICA